MGAGSVLCICVCGAGYLDGGLIFLSVTLWLSTINCFYVVYVPQINSENYDKLYHRSARHDSVYIISSVRLFVTDVKTFPLWFTTWIYRSEYWHHQNYSWVNVLTSYQEAFKGKQLNRPEMCLLMQMLSLEMQVMVTERTSGRKYHCKDFLYIWLLTMSLTFEPRIRVTCATHSISAKLFQIPSTYNITVESRTRV